MRPVPRGRVPFRIEVPSPVLDDLAERLARGRLPGAPADAGWDYGVEPGYLRRLVDYWRTDYDWRAVEARLNSLPQFMASVGGYRVDLVYEPGSGPAPLPLVLTHGWPGSFVEFEAVVEPLAHPERFGGRIEDAFDVVVPSLPGYGWSSAPSAPISPRDIARVWDELMTSTLGYERYAAQGGDWGGLVTSWLGVDAPSHVGAARPGRGGVGRADARAARARDRVPGHPGHEAPDAGVRAHRLAGGTRRVDRREVPRLEHARARRAALQDGADPDRHDDLIYWLTGCANTASWLYTAARRLDGMRLGRGEFVGVPTAFVACPHDLFPAPPDRWVRRVYHCVRRTELAVGWHFLAYERPAEFVEDVRGFFRDYRDGRSG